MFLHSLQVTFCKFSSLFAFICATSAIVLFPRASLQQNSHYSVSSRTSFKGFYVNFILIEFEIAFFIASLASFSRFLFNLFVLPDSPSCMTFNKRSSKHLRVFDLYTLSILLNIPQRSLCDLWVPTFLDVLMKSIVLGPNVPKFRSSILFNVVLPFKLLEDIYLSWINKQRSCRFCNSYVSSLRDSILLGYVRSCQSPFYAILSQKLIELFFTKFTIAIWIFFLSLFLLNF